MNDPLQKALVSVRLHSGRDGVCSVFARSNKATAPKGWSFDIAEPALTGAETLLGLLAGDIVGLFLDLCRKQRVVVDELESTIRAELTDPLAHLGVIGATGEPRYDAFVLKFYIATSAPHATISAIWNDAVSRAPLVNTLRRSAPLEISFQII